eukprot:6322298-Alexandrium_andersonii.AAC.1
MVYARVRLNGDPGRSSPFMRWHMLGPLNGVRSEEPGDALTLRHFKSDRKRDVDIETASDVGLNGLEPGGRTPGGEHVIPSGEALGPMGLAGAQGREPPVE